MKTKSKKILLGLVVIIILCFKASYAQNTTIEVEIFPLKYFFNGEEKIPNTGEEGFIYNDRTYVPIRFVSESLDKTVTWDEITYSIKIDDKINNEKLNYYTKKENYTLLQ